MLEIIKNPTDKVLMNLISQSDSKIILCAPFIKKSIINKIFNAKQKKANIVVITSSNISSFVRRASDIEAIELLLNNNVKVYNHQHLHAKVYSFNSAKALVTSSNLTFNGLIGNYEYGVLIDDKKVVSSIDDDLQCLIDDELSGEMNNETVDFIKKQIELFNENEYKIEVDDDGDEIIKSNETKISLSLHSWQKDVYDIIEKEMGPKFSLNEIYAYKDFFQTEHPENKNIKPKIRQILQQLRDKGIIKFEEPGLYKKLIK